MPSTNITTLTTANTVIQMMAKTNEIVVNYNALAVNNANTAVATSLAEQAAVAIAIALG